jgi:hypothetical protein
VKKVTIEGKFIIPWRKTLMVKADELIHFGDDVLGDDGEVYKIKEINMPTVPQSDSKAGLFSIICEG